MSIQRQLPINNRMHEINIHNGVVYLAGQVDDDASEGIESQTRATLANIDKVLAQAGTDKSRILSVTIYLKDIDAYFQGMNSEWDKWAAEGNAPARATVEARLAAPQFLVEMSVIAALP